MKFVYNLAFLMWFSLKVQSDTRSNLLIAFICWKMHGQKLSLSQQNNCLVHADLKFPGNVEAQ